jgi:hypothetical protein
LLRVQFVEKERVVAASRADLLSKGEQLLFI